MSSDNTFRPDEKKFRIEDLPSIFNLKINQEWLIQDLIPDNSLIMLTGESGCGKSTLVLSLADAVVTGKPFLGHPTVQRPVLIVDRENGLPIYAERFRRFGIEESPEFRFWGHWNDFEPGGPDHLAIQLFARDRKPLIIFDSLIAFHPGSEQSSDETRQYMDRYRQLVGLGATVLLIHHVGKGENTKDYRGSSDIKASVDAAFVLEPKKPLLKLLKLRPFKSREGVLDSTMISLEGNQFVAVDPGFVEKSDNAWKLVEMTLAEHPGCNQQAIIQKLPQLPASKVRKILLAGEADGTFSVMKGDKNASFYTLAIQ